MIEKLAKAPADIGVEGRRLWRSICADAAGQDLQLDAREREWLRRACKAADRIALIEAALVDADLVVPGHAKQPVSHPLLTELRQTEALLAQTLARLRVDVAENEAGIPVAVNQHRAAALARWSRR
jgi:hypothetical protein